MDAMDEDRFQMDVMPPSHPRCRRYELPWRHIQLPIAVKGFARGFLTIHRTTTSWHVPAGECGIANKLCGAISVEIAFSAEKGPLKGRIYGGVWHLGNIPYFAPNFCWPEFGQPMPILIELKRNQIDGQSAAFLVAIERSESFGRLT
jgi:hypothetical protein